MTRVVITTVSTYETEFPEYAVASESARQATEALICESMKNSLRTSDADVISCRCEVRPIMEKPTIN